MQDLLRYPARTDVFSRFSSAKRYIFNILGSNFNSQLAIELVTFDPEKRSSYKHLPSVITYSDGIATRLSLLKMRRFMRSPSNCICLNLFWCWYFSSSEWDVIAQADLVAWPRVASGVRTSSGTDLLIQN